MNMGIYKVPHEKAYYNIILYILYMDKFQKILEYLSMDCVANSAVGIKNMLYPLFKVY